MKLLRLAALPIALLGNQALAGEKWIAVAHGDHGALNVDKNSIRRDNDGLVYFTDEMGGAVSKVAADCTRRVQYILSFAYGGPAVDVPNWRKDGEVVKPNSSDDAEMNYVCANVP
jgi:hypothetical protein